MRKKISIYLLISFAFLGALTLNYLVSTDDGTMYRWWQWKPEKPTYWANQVGLKEHKIEMMKMHIEEIKMDNDDPELIDKLRARLASLESENFRLRNNLYNTSVPITITQPLLEGGSYSIVTQSSYETGPWLASPSLIRRANGTYIACYDAVIEPVRVFVSVSHDAGKTWERTAEIPLMRWPNLIEVENQVYIVGVHSIDGNGMKIVKMKTFSHWTDSVSILDDMKEVHTGNVGIVVANERLHLLVQKGRRNNWTVVHASIHADLMRKKSWKHSGNLHDPTATYFREMKEMLGIEESAHSQEGVLVPWNGGLVGVARVSDSQVCTLASLMFWDLEKKELSFMRFAHIPGLGVAKPALIYDPVSKLYWLLSNYNREILRDVSETSLGYTTRSFERCLIDRSILGLFYAKNPMDQWHLAGFVSYSKDWAHHSTYPSMLIENNDIILIARSHLNTPLNETTVNHGKQLYGNLNLAVDVTANNHNANMITFHRIVNFRQLVHPMMYYDEIQ